MLRLLVDENFNENIIRGVRRRLEDVDIIRVRDVGLSGADDPDILAWAAENGRAVLSHDVATMIGFAEERVRAGLRMPGLFEVPRRKAMAAVLDSLLLLLVCSVEGEWENQVVFLPFE